MLTKCLFICFIPGRYHDWKNMEIKKFDFLLTKEIHKFLFLATGHPCDNPTHKGSVIEYKACNNCTSKLNMVCGGAACTIVHHIWPDVIQY